MKPGDLVRSETSGWLREDPFRGAAIARYFMGNVFLVLPYQVPVGLPEAEIWYERVLDASGNIGFIHKDVIEVIGETG